MKLTEYVYRLAARIPGWKRILAVGRAHEDVLAQHFLKAFHKGRTLLPERFTSHQDAETTLDHIIQVVEQAMAKGLPGLLHDALADGGDVAATNLQYMPRQAESGSVFRIGKGQKSVPIDYAFDRTDEDAVAWAREHAGALIDGITKTTREKVRGIIGDVLDGSSTWDEAMDDLDDIFDDEDRVRAIARTESMTAVNEGQKDLWDQAVEDGYLNGDENQVWIVTPDDKLCDICDPMDGATAKLGEDFEEEGPPAHPNCRCTVGLLA